ncbi:MAG: polyprenyl synthetase family protein, partial [Methanoregulaceae archaeon]|nr:polyprenyl synthetase family protein [Methanoregulaceae archaeon]
LAREKGLDLSQYRRTLTDDEIDRVIADLRRLGVIDEVQEKAAELVRSSREIIGILPESDEKRLLNELSEFFVTRGS